MRISALVNTFNEEEHIQACLESLQWVDELVVADMGSSDRTVEIASRYATKVVSIPPGNFSEIRNAGLAEVSGDWVLLVDADERITPELAAEIRESLTATVKETGFFLPLYHQFLGRTLKHCFKYPEYRMRLYRNHPEHRYSGSVHERIYLTDGPKGKLTGEMTHLLHPTVERYIAKMNHYTSLAAEEAFNKGKRARLCHLVWRPPLHFFKAYLLKGGFLDRGRGFIYCVLSSFYSFVKTLKLWVRERKG
jgi:glycosyltransferase involved in cell wall biosynthesis